MKKPIAVILLLCICVGLGACAAAQPSADATPQPTPTPEPTPTPSPTPEDDGLPNIDTESWEFVLVNPWNEVQGDPPVLENFEGVPFDARIIGPLSDFAAAARAEGYTFRAFSGYRDYATQSYLYYKKVSEYGEERARTIVAYPGTSEHHTGLAADIVDGHYELLTSEIENTGLYKWMVQHCAEYGFIVRYPNGRTDVTGIIYEPWHFRYVGVEAATYIMENDLTLEEFLALYEKYK